jgi:predicted HAD superfamily Cof-like phosphohydrolase
MANTKTNFEKVQEFNRAFDMVSKEPINYSSGEFDEFGHPQYNSFIHIRPDLFITQSKTIKLRLDLIDEEIKELNHAIETNDFVETRDALSDILYVVYGMADVLGINIDSYMKIQLGDEVSRLSNNMEGNFMELIEKYNTDIGLTNFSYIKILVDIAKGDFKDKLNLSVAQNNINSNYKELENYCLSCVSFINIKTHEVFETITQYLKNILLWVYIYSYASGIDADADFTIVHNSNMSKLCDTEADAILTVANYVEKYIAGNSPYDSPYYYELPELGKWIVKNKSTGKSLKNIKYRKVEFTNNI